MNYYNEIDPFAAQWLRNLIEDGLIPKGYVDERSIVDVDPESLRAFTQCHFFAGIGGWAYALHLAGWPEERPVWTGSCPCQPFSVAGKGAGEGDSRHLWPAFRRLIAECRPSTVFGEQVASKDGRLWLAGVRADLEALGYAVGAADLCAAGISAPHIRQRLWWVADAASVRKQRKPGDPAVKGSPRHQSKQELGFRCSDGNGLADTQGIRSGERWENTTGSGERGCQEQGSKRECCSADGGMGIPNGAGPQPGCEATEAARYGRSVEPAGFWSDHQLVWCRDRKHRRIPIEPALFPLADGLPGRVGLLKGAGNAIVPQVAAEFIGAFLDILKSDER